MVRMPLLTWVAMGAALTAACPSTAQTGGSAAAPAQPQDAIPESATSAVAPGDADIGAIIVTARKQNETVLRAPVSISVLPPATIGDKNITLANQLNGIIPGLVQSAGANGVPATTIRGLGSNPTVFSTEPSVALFIDGTYLGHFRDYVTPFFDIDHLELIKGTQSTLLGKNTSLGAISLVNKRPTDSFSYNGTYTRSFETEGNHVDAAVNVPLGSAIAVRGAVYYNQDVGYNHNTFTDKDEPRTREISGRLSVSIKPADGIDGVFIYQHDYRRVNGQLLQLLLDPSFTIRNRAASFGQTLPVGRPFVIGNATTAISPLNPVAGPTPFDREVANRLNFIGNARLGEHTLTAQTSYVRWTSPRLLDYDFTAANLYNFGDYERNRVFSQEIRLSSPRAGRFTYLIGAFYYYNGYVYQRSFTAPAVATPQFPVSGSTNGQTHINTHSYSFFGSGTFEVFDGLKAEGGLRYTRERKGADFGRVSSGTLATTFPAVPFQTYPSQTVHPLDYNVGVDWQATGQLLVYGSYSKGSKSGGFQDFPTTVAGAPYRPEFAYSSEIGAKLNLSGGTFLTGALYNTRVKDFQVAVSTAIGTPPVQQQILGNAQVRSRGFEMSGGIRPLTGLKLGASLLYAKAIFTRNFPDNNAGLAAKGDRVPRAPHWGASGNADYEFNLSSDVRGFFGGNIDYTSLALLTFTRLSPDSPVIRSHAVVDGRIGVRTDRYSLTLSGTNLFNTNYVNFGTPSTAGGTGLFNRAYQGSYGRPRIIALTVSVKG